MPKGQCLSAIGGFKYFHMRRELKNKAFSKS